MGRIGKSLSLILILIVSLTIIGTSSAQTIPKPSVPEFTAKYVDRSYTVPSTTTIDPYNGEKITNPSRHVENKTLEITIKNQPFTPYIDSKTDSHWQITLMYQIRTKGHFAQNWTYLYFVSDGFLPASNSDYTIVSYSIGTGSVWGNLQSNDQVDFQVEAMIGYVHRTIGFMSWYFTGESSDWSATHTVTTPSSNVTPNPTVTSLPTPTVPELPSWIIPLLLGIILATAGLLVYHKKHKPN
jgi:hypothetical protein